MLTLKMQVIIFSRAAQTGRVRNKEDHVIKIDA